MPIRKLLVANRGEIACRIIRAARELGLETVLAASQADTESLAARLADDVQEIGPPQATKSYLDIGSILDAARRSGADAVHPGYGFLAENARFADEVEKAGLIFIGPKADTIRLMGDKVAARIQARSAGVPTVPGSNGIVTEIDEAVSVVERIGFPVMIKASAGGGGRGIRVANNVDDLRKLAPQASTEAAAAFGNRGIYIEKLIEKARHVEVQVLGDGIDVVHFYERECSLQRRRQKIWEEAPSVAIGGKVRSRLCDTAVNLTRSIGYRGAGTIEYLLDDSTGEFFFIEMNTRIQVEHPVTEMICGVDLVVGMIRVCAGERLWTTQDAISRSGHAIEVRINAENPANDFMPFPGTVSELNIPEGDGIRFDHMLYDGYVVPPFYDSLLGKLIVWAPSREKAVMRLTSALRCLRINGLHTTIPLFETLAMDPDVMSNAVHTGWMESWLEQNADKLGHQEETAT